MLRGNYLRVLTPRTTNGTNVMLDENRQQMFKESHLPLTAKKALEAQNRSLPDHLKKIIEIVYEGVEPQGAAFGPDQPKTRKKPGPKPKNLQS